MIFTFEVLYFCTNWNFFIKEQMDGKFFKTDTITIGTFKTILFLYKYFMCDNEILLNSLVC